MQICVRGNLFVWRTALSSGGSRQIAFISYSGRPALTRLGSREDDRGIGADRRRQRP